MRLKFFVIVITFVITAWHTIYGQQTSDPMPFTENNRIITMIVSYHLHHFEPIIETLKNCKYMCEAGWSPTIVIFTAGNVTHNIRNYVNSHLYCYRTETYMTMIFKEYDRSIKLKLVIEPRHYLKENIDKFDVAIYLEEDIIFEFSHLVAYLHELKKLQKLVGDKIAYEDYYIGFQRFWRDHGHAGHHSSVNSSTYPDYNTLHREYLQEIPFFQPICIAKEPYMEVVNMKRVPAANSFQAMWILTRNQLLVLQEKCTFLDQKLDKENWTLEYMGSLSLLENDVGLPSCNLKKIVPAERLMSFMILHRYRSMDPMFTHLSHPVYFTNRNVNAGLLQLEEPIAQVSYPTSKPCWDSIYSKNQKLLSTEDLEALNKTVFFAYEGPIYQLINGRKVSIGTESQLQKLGYTKKDVVLGKHPAFEYIPKEP